LIFSFVASLAVFSPALRSLNPSRQKTIDGLLRASVPVLSVNTCPIPHLANPFHLIQAHPKSLLLPRLVLPIKNKNIKSESSITLFIYSPIERRKSKATMSRKKNKEKQIKPLGIMGAMMGSLSRSVSSSWFNASVVIPSN